MYGYRKKYGGAKLKSNICKEALLLVETKPSAVEINSVETYITEMGIDDATRWLGSKYSESLAKKIVALPSEHPMIETYVDIDYSGVASFVGDYRSNFLCVFIEEPLGFTTLETISYRGKDYQFSDAFFLRKRPQGVSITGRLEDKE